ncbi:MAG TPA: hypothetical protein VNA17_06220 [Pyrinomonadaceae bacterium]|nr:hypothetical protein [Pyrinomonadaceae bacterium]
MAKFVEDQIEVAGQFASEEEASEYAQDQQMNDPSNGYDYVIQRPRPSDQRVNILPGLGTTQTEAQIIYRGAPALPALYPPARQTEPKPAPVFCL